MRHCTVTWNAARCLHVQRSRSTVDIWFLNFQEADSGNGAQEKEHFFSTDAFV